MQAHFIVFYKSVINFPQIKVLRELMHMSIPTVQQTNPRGT